MWPWEHAAQVSLQDRPCCQEQRGELAASSCCIFRSRAEACCPQAASSTGDTRPRPPDSEHRGSVTETQVQSCCSYPTWVSSSEQSLLRASHQPDWDFLQHRALPPNGPSFHLSLPRNRTCTTSEESATLSCSVSSLSSQAFPPINLMHFCFLEDPNGHRS